MCLQCFDTVGRQEGHPVCKKYGDGGGGLWLVRLEWRPAGWSVYLPLLIFPCTIKSRSFLLALAHLGGLGKRAVEWLWWWWWLWCDWRVCGCDSCRCLLMWYVDRVLLLCPSVMLTTHWHQTPASLVLTSHSADGKLMGRLRQLWSAGRLVDNFVVEAAFVLSTDVN